MSRLSPHQNERWIELHGWASEVGWVHHMDRLDVDDHHLVDSDPPSLEEEEDQHPND